MRSLVECAGYCCFFSDWNGMPIIILLISLCQHFVVVPFVFLLYLIFHFVAGRNSEPKKEFIKKLLMHSSSDPIQMRAVLCRGGH